MSGITVKSNVPGAAVAEIIEEMSDVIEAHPRSHVIIACLTTAVLCQNPDITAEELHQIVMGCSQYICSALELAELHVPTDDLPKNMVN